MLVILPIWEENARQVSIKWPQDELPHKPRHSENSSPPHLAFRISACQMPLLVSEEHSHAGRVLAHAGPRVPSAAETAA